MKKKITIKDILVLQIVIAIYTLSTVMAKLASGQPLFSVGFFGFYGAELLILGIYALPWQQRIKIFDLSVAYTNRAMALLWPLIWAVVTFKDNITVKKVKGVALVIAGT